MEITRQVTRELSYRLREDEASGMYTLEFRDHSWKETVGDFLSKEQIEQLILDLRLIINDL